MTNEQLVLLLRKYSLSLEAAYDEMYSLMPENLRAVDESGFSNALKFTKPVLEVLELLEIDIENLSGSLSAGASQQKHPK